MKEVGVTLSLRVFWVFMSHKIGIMLSHSYAPHLPVSEREEGLRGRAGVPVLFFFGSSCLAGKDGHFASDSSGGRIHLVITNAGSSIVSNFLAVSCFTGKGLKERKERVAQINIAHKTRRKTNRD